MPARLTLRSPGLPPRVVPLEDGREHRVGRDRSCDVAIDDDRVSRLHAVLRPGGQGWLVTDLGSKNGTTVDGVAADPTRPLPDGCAISFGGLVARFDVVTPTAEDERARAARWRTSIALQRELRPAAGVEALVRRLLDSVRTLTGAERGFVLLAGDDGRLEVAYTAGLEFADLAGETFAGSIGAVERVVATGSPLVLADSLDDTALQGRASVLARGIRQLVVLPLDALERRIGVLYADAFRPGRELAALDLEILAALADHAALAIAAARLDAELRALRERIAEPVRRDEPPRASPPETTATCWEEILLTHRSRGRR